MNGAVFQTSAMMTATLGGVALGGPEDFAAEQGVGDAVGLEDPAPQQAGDGGGHGPGDQDAGAQEGPAAEGAVHGQGQAEAQDGLEEHRGDGEEGGVGEGVEEAPAGFADEQVGVVGQAHEGFDVGDEAVRVQAGFGAEQGLVHRGEQRVHDHQGQHQDGGGEQHRGHAAFAGGAFAASARAGWLGRAGLRAGGRGGRRRHAGYLTGVAAAWPAGVDRPARRVV